MYGIADVRGLLASFEMNIDIICLTATKLGNNVKKCIYILIKSRKIANAVKLVSHFQSNL